MTPSTSAVIRARAGRLGVADSAGGVRGFASRTSVPSGAAAFLAPCSENRSAPPTSAPRIVRIRLLPSRRVTRASCREQTVDNDYRDEDKERREVQRANAHRGDHVEHREQGGTQHGKRSAALWIAGYERKQGQHQ